MIVDIDEGFDFLGFRIQRQTKRGSNKRYVYTWPAKKALASIKAKVKTISKQGTNQPLSAVLRQLNGVLRGWTTYFRHGVSKTTFAYVHQFTWLRVVGWLRRKHRRANWKWLRRRYLANRWWPEHDGMALFDCRAVPVTRYRYRGTRIPTPWSVTEHRRLTNGTGSWRAGCGGSRTSGSGDGPEKPTRRKADRALRSDPTSPTRRSMSADGGCRTRPSAIVAARPTRSTAAGAGSSWPASGSASTATTSSLGLLAAGDPKREVWFAWNAKEVVRQIYDHTDHQLAVAWVDEIVRDFADGEMPLEVRRLGRTIKRVARPDRRLAPLPRVERADRSRQQPGQARQAGRVRVPPLPTTTGSAHSSTPEDPTGPAQHPHPTLKSRSAGTWCRTWSRCWPSGRRAPTCYGDRCRRSRWSGRRPAQPLRIASIDTPGMQFKNTSTPRMRSSAS